MKSAIEPGDKVTVFKFLQLIYHAGLCIGYYYDGEPEILDVTWTHGLQQRRLSEFLNGREIVSIYSPSDSIETVLARAQGVIECNKTEGFHYSYFVSNCQALVNYCQKGQLRSEQVDGFFGLAAATALIALTTRLASQSGKGS